MTPNGTASYEVKSVSSTLNTWRTTFMWLDFGFLLLFLVEILVGVLAEGMVYWKQMVNIFDTTVVTVSFAISIVYVLN